MWQGESYMNTILHSQPKLYFFNTIVFLKGHVYKKILTNHMKIHLGLKAFKCNDCGMVHKYYLIYSQSLITIFLIVIITQCIS
jgi:hypothetical protein